jgi:hypothetical protein
MPVQSVTLNLPEPVYEQIQRAAVKTKRRVDEIMAEAVAAVAPVADSAPPKFACGVGANGLSLGAVNIELPA